MVTDRAFYQSLRIGSGGRVFKREVITLEGCADFRGRDEAEKMFRGLLSSNVAKAGGVIPSIVKGGDSEGGIAPFDFGAPGRGRGA